jgi:hypothetical protein
MACWQEGLESCRVYRRDGGGREIGGDEGYTGLR